MVSFLSWLGFFFASIPETFYLYIHFYLYTLFVFFILSVFRQLPLHPPTPNLLKPP